MQDEFITLRELALLLLLFAAPVYVVGALVLLVALARRPRRARPARRTVARALAVATVLAVPLAAQAALSPGGGALGFAGYISLPALAASMVCYGATAVYLARRRPAA
jgi:hypothetical protein